MHVLVITHAADRLARSGRYMMMPVLHELARMGHDVTITVGIPPPPAPRADFAILHVDLTVVPPDYIAFATQYERCLNIDVTDISKRRVSGAAIGPGDETWSGPVLVKPNLNCGAIPEIRARLASAKEPLHGFRVYESMAAVPEHTAADPTLVVERFLPEREGRSYVTRFWSFMGAEERCARVVSNHPVVKATNQVGFEFCEVPGELRRRRKELAFDFGKFDFVIHEGKAVLIDANKTPGLPPVSKESVWPADFARGLLSWAG